VKVCPRAWNELRLRFKQRVISLQKQQRRISPKVFSLLGDRDYDHALESLEKAARFVAE